MSKMKFSESQKHEREEQAIFGEVRAGSLPPFSVISFPPSVSKAHSGHPEELQPSRCSQDGHARVIHALRKEDETRDRKR